MGLPWHPRLLRDRGPCILATALPADGQQPWDWGGPSWGRGHPRSHIPRLLAPHNFPGLRLRRRQASFKGSAAI